MSVVTNSLHESASMQAVNKVTQQSCLQERSTLRALFGSDIDVLPFPEFLRRYVPGLCNKLLLDRSLSEHLQLSNSFVVPLPSFKRIEKEQGIVQEHLSSLVDDVVWSLVQRRQRLRRHRKDGRNLLSQGYTVPSDFHILTGAQSSRNMPSGVHMLQLNNNVDFCKSSSLFASLHRLVGDNVLRALLLHTSIFIPITSESTVASENFLQLTGPPAQGRSTIQEGVAGLKKRKRRRPQATLVELEKAKHLLSASILPRKDLFYRESYTPLVGLPSIHVLNGPTDPELLLNELLEINSGKCLKRIRKLGYPICHEIFRNYKRCNLKRILDRYCPLPEVCQKPKGSVALEDLSKAFSAAAEVVSFLKSVLKQIFPVALWGSSLNTDHFMEHVETFVKLRRQEKMSNRMLTDGIRVTKVPWLVGNGRSLHSHEHQQAERNLLCVARWVMLDFVLPLLKSTFHVTESEFSGKQVLYYRKPVWSMFRALAMEKFLKSQYTEISKDEARARVLEQDMGFSRLRLLPKENGVRPIAMLCKREKILAEKGTPPALHIHCEENAGPVGKMDKQPPPKKCKLEQSEMHGKSSPIPHAAMSSLSTNTVLSEAFAVLKYEHEKDRGNFGAGVRGLHYFYPRYRKLIDEVAPRKNSMQLYFGSVDIEHCYDNINQERLLDIVSSILSEETYLIQRYNLLYHLESMSRVVKRTKTIVGPPESFDPFYHTVQYLGNKHHRCVFVDGVGGGVVRKEQILKQLREHLTCHLVVAKGRYGDRYLLQSTGIPQGSVLSSLLCNFYYGRIEKILLPQYFETCNDTTGAPNVSHNSLLARMVDDFLLITTHKPSITSFLKTMIEGEPRLGVQIHKEKSQSSVDISIRSEGNSDLFLVAQAGSIFQWCGMLFDTRTGEVRIDYTRFYDGKTGNSLNVEHVFRQGEQLAVQMKIFVRPRCIPILFDSVINSRRVQLINFYQLMVVGASKTAIYLQSSSMASTLLSNTCFILDSIDATIVYAYSLIGERLKAYDSPISLAQSSAIWLGWQAFIDVFYRLESFADFRLYLDERQPRDGKESLIQVARVALSELDIERLI